MKKEILSIATLVILLSLLCYFVVNSSFTQQEKSLNEKEQQQIKIAYDATSQMYGFSMRTIVEELIEKPEILDILQKANLANTIKKKKLRGQLYRKLYPIYEDKLSQFDIRQFHFHLASGESFLRFNDPSSSGDNLFNFRPSLRRANIDKKYSSGFEGGRVSPGFRHVFPLFQDKQHLGSVEFSLAFGALEKEMSMLMPHMKLMIIMKRAITTDIVFKEHVERFVPYSLSRDYVIENPLISKLNKHYQESSLITDIYDYLAYHPSMKAKIAEKLTYGEAFSQVLKPRANKIYSIHFVPIYDTNNLLAAYLVGHNPYSNIEDLETKRIVALGLGFLFCFVFGIVLFLLASNRRVTIEQKNELETIAKTIENGLIVLNKKGVLTFINNSACNMLGYKEDELKGKIVHGMIHYHSTLDTEHCPIINVAKVGISYSGEEKFIKKSGLVFPVDVSSVPLLENGETVGSVTVFRDITDQKKSEEKVKKLAYYDSLTKIPNRKLFFDTLEYTIEKSKNIKIYSGLIYIDLDNFKSINDTFGHQVGDELLQQVASRLSLEIRQEDTVGRIGGDEFAIIIDILDTDLEHSKTIFNVIVNKIHSAFRAEFLLNKIPFHCFASIGGVVFRGDNVTPKKLIEKTDKIMYEAKNSGKDTFKIQAY